jgi:hypothetical protein
METKHPQESEIRHKKPEVVDLSQPRVLYTEDVALLLRIKPDTVLARHRRGTLPVKARNKPGRGIPLEWSSLDWWKYFNGKPK